MTALYNEIDPFAAQTLRNLIAAGQIAPGDVCERDIRDLTAADVLGYTQFHAFAGVGVWSLALRRAGWPDDRPVWTGSCPCQPFSAAGRGDGFTDERHLWPAWFHLLDICRPPEVFGEQVASKDGLMWLDLVSADLEGAGNAFGAQDICAAGLGAPHIRQRLWFVGTRGIQHAARNGWLKRRAKSGERGLICGRCFSDLANCCCSGLERRDSRALGRQCPTVERGGAARRLADHHDPERGPDDTGWDLIDGPDARWPQGPGDAEGCGGTDRLVDSDQPVTGQEREQRSGLGQDQRTGSAERRAGPVNGHWGTADWLFCRDGKWRPVEPGTFPLAHGATERVGRLRAYGNAIVAQVAQHWIETFLESEADSHADPDRDLIG